MEIAEAPRTRKHIQKEQLGPIPIEKLIMSENPAAFILRWSPGYYKNRGAGVGVGRDDI